MSIQTLRYSSLTSTFAVLCALVSHVSAVAIVQQNGNGCFNGATDTFVVPTSICLAANTGNNALAFNTGGSYTVTCSNGQANVNAFLDNFCNVADVSNQFVVGSCSAGFTFLSCDGNNAVGGMFPQMVYSFPDTTCTGVGVGTALNAGTLCDTSNYLNPTQSTLFSCSANTASISTFAVTSCNSATPINTALVSPATCTADPATSAGGIKVDCGGGIPNGGVTGTHSNAITLASILLSIIITFMSAWQQ